MPNWCDNHLYLSHPDPAMIDRAVAAFERGELFNEFVPVPEELLPGNKAENDAEQNIAKFGFPSWYEFRIAKWGTKWDVGLDDNDNDEILYRGRKEAAFRFASAWTPPLDWCSTLYDDLGFSVEIVYNETGMAFCGKWVDGVDNCYDYGEETSKTVRNLIGKDLDEVLNLSEAMAEWEAWNAEAS